MLCSAKPARMRVAFCATAGILSALAPLMIKETVFLLSECRQASGRQGLAHDSLCPLFIVWSLQLLIWTSSFRVRLDHSEDVRTERSNVAQSRISDRRVVSLFERMLDGLVGGERCWVGIGWFKVDFGGLWAKGLTCMMSLYRLAIRATLSNCNRSWIPCVMMISAHGESLMVRRCFNVVVNREPS